MKRFAAEMKMESNGLGIYQLLLQLVVFPVDQYHCFLEDW